MGATHLRSRCPNAQDDTSTDLGAFTSVSVDTGFVSMSAGLLSPLPSPKFTFTELQDIQNPELNGFNVARPA